MSEEEIRDEHKENYARFVSKFIQEIGKSLNGKIDEFYELRNTFNRQHPPTFIMDVLCGFIGATVSSLMKMSNDSNGVSEFIKEKINYTIDKSILRGLKTEVAQDNVQDNVVSKEDDLTSYKYDYNKYITKITEKLVNVINSSSNEFNQLKSDFTVKNNVIFMMDCLYGLIGTMMMSLLSETHDPCGAFSVFKEKINEVLSTSLKLAIQESKGNVH